MSEKGRRITWEEALEGCSRVHTEAMERRFKNCEAFTGKDSEALAWDLVNELRKERDALRERVAELEDLPGDAYQALIRVPESHDQP